MFADIAKPLVNLTRGLRSVDNRSSKAKEAFEILKGALSEDIVLNFPDFTRNFILATDANKFAIGGVLQQRDDAGVLRPLSYFSRALKGPELNYSTIEREALAIVFGLWGKSYYSSRLSGGGPFGPSAFVTFIHK